jgi:hypothetical protein
MRESTFSNGAFHLPSVAEDVLRISFDLKLMLGLTVGLVLHNSSAKS